MHVTRKTNTELALVDSSIWVSVFCCLPVFRRPTHRLRRASRADFGSPAFFVLCAFLFWRKEVVVFDAGRQQATWWRRRAFKAANGTVPFSEITGIGMEASAAGSNGMLTYRLTILTSGQAGADVGCVQRRQTGITIRSRQRFCDFSTWTMRSLVDFAESRMRIRSSRC